MIGHCARCGVDGPVVKSVEKSQMSGKMREVFVCAGGCKSERLRSENIKAGAEAQKRRGSVA